MNRFNLIVGNFVLGCLALSGTKGFAQRMEDLLKYDLAMFDRPSLKSTETVLVFQPGLKDLWFKALERSEPETLRMTIDTIVVAHRQGVPGMKESIGPLTELLREPNQRTEVVRACAAALIALDARQSAKSLWETSQKRGESIQEIVEPAMAEWRVPDCIDVWIERLKKSNVTDRSRRWAIHGVGALKADAAFDPLKQILLKPTNPLRNRVAAAKAIGSLRSSGMHSLAKDLWTPGSQSDVLSALLAVELLRNHDDETARDLLGELAVHPISAVQAAALEVLFKMDYRLVDQEADKLLSSSDTTVRYWCAKAMLATVNRDRIISLAALLNDENPKLRRLVADGLVDWGEQPEIRSEIIEEVSGVLASDNWRGCEQACVVLAKLDHKPSGTRMVELLLHPRAEVQVASAWALTQLRIEDRLPDMLQYAQSIYDGIDSGKLVTIDPWATLPAAHVFIGLGDQRYEPATPLLRKFARKRLELGVYARPAAAWALGMIHEDAGPKDIVVELTQRLNDRDSLAPELDEMRRMCAISLGRMNAKESLPSLRKQSENMWACHWAIERITGEPMPPPKKKTTEVGDWFLSPVSR